MSTPYVLDACALVAFLRKEEGWERVKSVLLGAQDEAYKCYWRHSSYI